MERDLLLTPTSINSQGSCPALDRTSHPSSQNLTFLISSDTSAAPTKTETSVKATQFRQSSHPSAEAATKSNNSTHLDGTMSPAKSPSGNVSMNLNSSEPQEKALVSPSECSSNTPKIPTLSRLSQSASAPAGLDGIAPTDPSSSSNTDMNPATLSSPPKKLTFASIAKTVILQERLRKAEANAEDEEEGESPAELRMRLNVTVFSKPLMLFI